MSHRNSILRRHLETLTTAAFIGALSLITGPASAESMFGDQSFERGGTSAAIARPATPVTGRDRTAIRLPSKLPDGVELQLVAEYSSDIPGVQKVRLMKVTLGPGARLANFAINDPLFCNSTKGTISVVDHATGATTVYAPGDHWAFARGQYTLFNPGDVTHEHYLYEMTRRSAYRVHGVL